MNITFLSILFSFLILFLLIGSIYGRWRSAHFLKQFSAPRLFPLLLSNFSSKKSYLKKYLFAIAVLLVGFSLCAPRWGYEDVERPSKNIDLLFGVDVSKSMLAEDLKPNRLERTKLAILDIVHEFPGCRVGLIAFAGDAFLQCPLTLDHNAFIQTLNALDTDIIPVPGTAISSALEIAKQIYKSSNEQKLFLLFTDGEDFSINLKHDLDDSIETYTVGIGSTEGATIPLKGGKLLTDRRGQVVKTTLDETTLKTIAQATRGKYYNLTPHFTQLITKHLKEKCPDTEKTHIERIYKERYQTFLLIGFLLLLLETLIGTRKTALHPFLLDQRWCIICVLCLLSPSLFARDSEGEKLYNAQNYEEALKFYQSQDKNNDPKLSFNLGTTQIALGQFKDAIDSLNQSLRNAQPELQSKIFYNLGNAQFKYGETFPSPEEKLKQWEESCKSFRSAFELDNSFADAQKNLKFVEQEIEKLKQQQSKNDQNKEAPKDSKKDQQSNAPDKNNQDSDQKDDNKEQNKNNQQNDKKDQSKDNEKNNSESKDQKNNDSESDQQQDQSKDNEDRDSENKNEQNKQEPQNNDQQSEDKESQNDNEQQKNDQQQNNDQQNQQSPKDNNQPQNQSPEDQQSKEDKQQSSEDQQSPQQPDENNSNNKPQPQNNSQSPQNENQQSQGQSSNTPQQMSEHDARQLLNSLEHGEKVLPLHRVQKRVTSRNIEKFW